MKRFFFALGIVGIIVYVSGCEKLKSYPDAPEISFKKLTYKNIEHPELGTSKVTILTFSFVDGDGDLGVRDSLTENHSAVYVTWQKKLGDATYEDYKFPDSTIVQKFQIPYDDVMDKEEANNRTLKGTIDVQLMPPLGPPPGMDSVRLEYYIMDRAYNKSNVDHTPDFSLLDEEMEIEAGK